MTGIDKGNGDGCEAALPTPALKAAMRLTQLYRSTGPDRAVMIPCWIIDGELRLVVSGKVETLGRFDDD